MKPTHPYLRLVSSCVHDVEETTRIQGAVSYDERALIAAIQRGDPSLAGRLFDRLIGALDVAVYRVMGRRGEDHEEILKVCFQRIISAIFNDTFCRECSLISWAGQVGSRVALESLHRTRLERVGGTPDAQRRTFQKSDGTASAMITRQSMSNARVVLSAMGPRAEILVLHDLQGYSLTKTATILGLTSAVTRARLDRLRYDFLSHGGVANGGEKSDVTAEVPRQEDKDRVRSALRVLVPLESEAQVRARKQLMLSRIERAIFDAPGMHIRKRRMRVWSQMALVTMLFMLAFMGGLFFE